MASSVEGSGGANTEGLLLLKNKGKVVVEGTQQLARVARAVAGPARAQPQL